MENIMPAFMADFFRVIFDIIFSAGLVAVLVFMVIWSITMIIELWKINFDMIEKLIKSFKVSRQDKRAPVEVKAGSNK